MIRLLSIAVTLIFMASAQAGETEVQACLCQGMKLEEPVKSGAFVDCVSDTHAIEVDPTSKWAEALGQALHYSDQTGKRAMVFLYCEIGETSCESHINRLESTIVNKGLDVDREYLDERTLFDRCRN